MSFDFYTAILPDGSKPSFVDFSDFLDHCRYYEILYPAVLLPTRISLSVSRVLGVCSFYPFIFCEQEGVRNGF